MLPSGYDSPNCHTELQPSFAMATTDERIHRATRLGVVDRKRLHAAGVSDDAIKSRLRNGTLRRLYPGVYATFGTPLGTDARLLAACWATGDSAVASHRAALWLWGLLDGEPPMEVIAPSTSKAAPRGVLVHRPTLLRSVDVTSRRAIPVTTPMRALLDAGAVLPRSVLSESVERALMTRLVTVKGLRMVLADLGSRGRNGAGPLRRHLDRRALGDKRPESMIEPLMARLLLDDLGIGPVDYQPTLVLEGRRVRPDFLVRLAKLVVEVDGLDAHASREALDADLERQNLMTRHGYLVLRYTVTHLRAPARIAAEIRAVSLERIAAVRDQVA